MNTCLPQEELCKTLATIVQRALLIRPLYSLEKNPILYDITMLINLF